MVRNIFCTLVVGMFFFYGCGGKKTTAPQNDSGMPDFVLNPPKEAGFLFGTGIAEQTSPQLAKETADLRAKKEIARVLSEKMSSLMKDYLGQAGIGQEAEVTEFVQSVTKSITDVELIGCAIERREFIAGKMYSLAKFPLDETMRKMIMDVVRKNISSREALLSEFRAKQGFEDLEKELQKLQDKQQ
jgi:hypothetical protein